MVTKKRATKAKTTNGRHHMEAELAVHVAAILAHPFTSSNLYNAIVDEMSDMLSDVPSNESSDTSEMIEFVLNWHRGFGFRVSGQYTEVKLPDGNIITHLQGNKEPRPVTRF